MFLPRVFIALGILILSGCSTTSLDTYTTLRYELMGVDDVVVTSEKVEKLPLASAYLRFGDNPQAFVILAFADADGSLGWISADEKMFVARAGRLVKTVGLDNDLYLMTSSSVDPLVRAKQTPNELLQPDSMTWQYTAEWDKDFVSGYRIRTQFVSAIPEKLVILDKTYDVVFVEEEAVVEHNQETWHNYHWFERETGRLLKTKQQLGPSLPVIEMTILKPYSL